MSHYLRFGLMIATSIVVMFCLKYLSTYELGHVFYSEMRTYMALMMGAAMAVVMLSFMLPMHKNKRMNVGIYGGSVIVFMLTLFLIRSQATIGDSSYMRSMIPHHSIAVLTSERSEIADFRVRELADGIIKAQRKEIKEMEWLLDDIASNGKATSTEEAQERPVPDFEGKL